MTENSVHAPAGTVVTIIAGDGTGRLAIATRAQAELIELLATLVLHSLERDTANDDNGLTQKQSACGEFGNATNPRQVAGRAGCADLSTASSDIRHDCQALPVVSPIYGRRSREV